MTEALPSNTEKKYRATIDTDFDDNGNGKQDLKFYESNNGTTVNEPSILVTDPTKEKMANYVVEVVLADSTGPGDEVATTDPAAVVDEGDVKPADTAAAQSTDGGAATSTLDPTMVIQQGIALEALKDKLTRDEIKAKIKAKLTSISDADLDTMVAAVEAQADTSRLPQPPTGTDQGGGRRRTKRKGRKGSKKSKKGAKKSKRSSKQSKKGGRSRKNHRKQSRRRKH